MAFSSNIYVMVKIFKVPSSRNSKSCLNIFFPILNLTAFPVETQYAFPEKRISTKHKIAYIT